MPDLELEPEDHIYRLRGVQIPGCTHVLTAVGAAPSFWFLTPEELQFYRDRGTAVHKAIEMVIKGTFDRRFPDCAWLKPYVKGWERFCNDYNVEVCMAPSAFDIETYKCDKCQLVYPTFDPDAACPRCQTGRVKLIRVAQPFTEIPLHHNAYRYGVMPDVVAIVRSANGDPAPIELKATSAHSAATQIQTAAQELAVEHSLGIKLSGRRWSVRLLPEEPFYDPIDYKERGDRSTWIGMLSTYNWLRRHNPAALRSSG